MDDASLIHIKTKTNISLYSDSHKDVKTLVVGLVALVMYIVLARLFPESQYYFC
jgi:hypothetical protein